MEWDYSTNLHCMFDYKSNENDSDKASQAKSKETFFFYAWHSPSPQASVFDKDVYKKLSQD